MGDKTCVTAFEMGILRVLRQLDIEQSEKNSVRWTHRRTNEWV